MAWYKTGTVSATNGSATVTGVGTDFVANAQVGEEFRLAGGQRGYEITAINSKTSLTISPAYMDSTQSGASYVIVPTRGFANEARDALRSILATLDDYLDGPLSGLFDSGTVGAPGLGSKTDTNTGFYWPSSDQIAAATNGIRRLLLSAAALQVDVPLTGSAIVQSPSDATAGRVPTVGWMGLGSDGAPYINDFSLELRGGFYTFTGASLNGPFTTGNQGVAVVGRSGNGDTLILAMRQSAAIPSVYFGRRQGSAGAPTWVEMRTTSNTTVDANGFLKQASPIVRLFDDHIDEPVQATGAAMNRVETGVYTLTGTLGLAQSGWQIEVPADHNGNRLCHVATHWADDVLTITVSTPVFSAGMWVAGDPMDVPAGRWIDLRLHDDVGETNGY